MSKPHILYRADLRCPNCKSAPEVIRMTDENTEQFWWEENGTTYPVLLRHTELAARHCPFRTEIYHLTLPLAIGVWKEEIKNRKQRK